MRQDHDKSVDPVGSKTGDRLPPLDRAFGNQGSKFACSGMLDGDEPVDIVVTNDVTSVLVEPYEHILVGDLVTFTATGNELKSSLEFNVLRAGSIPEDELPDDLPRPSAANGPESVTYTSSGRRNSTVIAPYVRASWSTLLRWGYHSTSF